MLLTLFINDWRGVNQQEQILPPAVETNLSADLVAFQQLLFYRSPKTIAKLFVKTRMNLRIGSRKYLDELISGPLSHHKKLIEKKEDEPSGQYGYEKGSENCYQEYVNVLTLESKTLGLEEEPETHDLSRCRVWVRAVMLTGQLRA